MSEHFRYAVFHDEIHHFHLRVVSTDAVDAWLAQMSAIVDRDGTLGRVLIRLPDDFLPPIRYSLRHVRQWMLRYPQTFQSTRTAVVLPYGKGLRSVLQTFHYTLTRGRPTQVGFFFTGEHDDAIQWLLQSEPESVALPE